MRKFRPRLSAILRKGGHKITAFERKVYAAVMEIPAGQTRSYGWVASRIGNPGACRAVGNALNRNPLLGVVPCHRVIRSDGSIGGFAKGIERKRALLRREGATFGTRSHTTR